MFSMGGCPSGLGNIAGRQARTSGQISVLSSASPNFDTKLPWSSKKRGETSTRTRVPTCVITPLLISSSSPLLTEACIYFHVLFLLFIFWGSKSKVHSQKTGFLFYKSLLDRSLHSDHTTEEREALYSFCHILVCDQSSFN